MEKTQGERESASEFCIVLITVGVEDEAERIARHLVAERLAAAVNIVAGVRSFYRWEGAIQDAQELLLIAKTCLALVDRLVEAIRPLHSYEVFSAVAVGIDAGDREYLEWVREETDQSE